MRWSRTVTAAAIAVLSAMIVLQAQEAPAPAAPPTSPTAAQIKEELETIKKGRTLALFQADGEAGTETRLQVENASLFDIVVLIVGPTTERVTLAPYRMQILTLEPGDYELAVTAAGRNLPPFYGKQKITANNLYRYKLSMPTV